MTHKRHSPSWEGYMGDFLRGNVGINHLNPQYQFFDAIGFEKQLNENTTYIALLSLEEAKDVLEDIDSPKAKSPFMKKMFSVADPISPYAGNIRDAFDFINVVGEFKKLGIKATEYVGKNGQRYIKISGHAGLRKIITASRYSASNMKIIYPMDFKMHRDGKGVNPREHRELCDRGERVQPTKRQLERRRVYLWG
ncbi:hypothetical protein [Photorhabdus sp. RM96S]|uniref:hypothetical protein n=2 Tax=Photorhabdus TaxID=29487 RepID=UPI0036DE6E17